jgi:L-erythro-3,5-diaminohexanoate dehydrogenase
VIAFGRSEESCRLVKDLGLADIVLSGDAKDPVGTYRKVLEAAGGLCDLTVNLVNLPGTEGASILCTRNGGIVYFFSMATSFTSAALTAEGLGRDIDMLIGNGYTEGWVETAFDILRRNERLRSHFEEKYGN